MNTKQEEMLLEENQKLKEELERAQQKQEHMSRQIAMAVGLRYHLMPDVYPVFADVPQVDVYADQIGIAEAGGDFFDMFRIDADHIGIVMADIFDGGEEAALYMVAFKLYLSGELSMGFTPGKLIEVVNSRLVANNEDNLCLSAFYGVYEISTGILTAVNASSETPVILRNGQAKLCSQDRKSYLLAVTEGITYEEYQIQLEKDDVFVLYTDGAIRAENSLGENFGSDRLLDVLSNSKENRADEIVGDLQTGLFSFIGDTPLKDDASFLCLIRKEVEA